MTETNEAMVEYEATHWLMLRFGYQRIWMSADGHLVVKCNAITMTHQYITAIKAEVLV